MQSAMADESPGVRCQDCRDVFLQTFAEMRRNPILICSRCGATTKVVLNYGALDAALQAIDRSTELSVPGP